MNLFCKSLAIVDGCGGLSSNCVVQKKHNTYGEIMLIKGIVRKEYYSKPTCLEL